MSALPPSIGAEPGALEPSFSIEEHRSAEATASGLCEDLASGRSIIERCLFPLLVSVIDAKRAPRAFLAKCGLDLELLLKSRPELLANLTRAIDGLRPHQVGHQGFTLGIGVVWIRPHPDGTPGRIFALNLDGNPAT